MSVLLRACDLIDALNTRIGQVAAWAALAMVLMQFAVVMLRYVFGIGLIMMQEGVLYLHSILFLLGAGYTLLAGGHVRVDIFYADAKTTTRRRIDLLGGVLLLLPFCAAVLWTSVPYVSASWGVLEGSQETSGIQGVYLLKTAILAFAVLLALQGMSLVGRAWLGLKGRD